MPRSPILRSLGTAADNRAPSPGRTLHVPSELVREPRLMVPGRIPIEMCRVAKENPIARGLMAVYIPGISLLNIIDNETRLVMSGSSKISVKDGDLCLDDSGGVGSAKNNAPNGNLKPSSQLTALWYGFSSTTPSNREGYQYLFGVNYDSSDNAPYSSWSINGNTSDTDTINVTWNNGSVQGLSCDGAIKNKRQIFCLRIGSIAELFVDGVSVANSASVGTISYSATGSINLGSGHPLTPGYNGMYTYLAYLWHRALSDGEMANIHRDPCQFLIPA